MIQLKEIAKQERAKDKEWGEKKLYVSTKRKEERERTADEAGEWKSGKSPNTFFLQRPGPL